jgi:hypothetical protein
MRQRHYRLRKTDKTKIVFFPIFCNYEVRIIFTHNLEKSFKRFKHTRDVEPRAGVDAVTIHVKNEDISYIFFLYKKSDTGTMAHEAYHVIEQLLELHDVGTHGEVAAYHLGYLVNQIVDLALQ